MPFGIDFGTTNSALTEFSPISGQKTPYGPGDRPFPSLVAIDKLTGEVVAVGREVRKKREALAKTCQIFSSIKTVLGDDSFSSYNFNGQEWSATRVAAEIFKGLLSYAEEEVGIVIKEAVVAIPVGFSPKKRQALREAANMAGITIKDFISEPTAALFNNWQEVKRWNRVVVFDWGGGTLDIALLHLNGEKVREIDSVGRPLGGDDLDKKIAEYLYSIFQKENDINMSFSDLEPHREDRKNYHPKDRLLTTSEEAKCALANDLQHEIVLDNLLRTEKGMLSFRYSLTRDELENLLEKEYDDVVGELSKILHKNGLKPEEIGCVLMVGGSSKLHGLYERIFESMGNHCQIIKPGPGADWEVSGGASMLASVSGEYLLSDDIGLELANDYIFPLTNNGAPLKNCHGKLNIGITEDTETAIFNFVRRIDRKRPFDMDNAERIGTALVPCNGFVNEVISLQYEIDKNHAFRAQMKSSWKKEYKITDWEYAKLQFDYELP